MLAVKTGSIPIANNVDRMCGPTYGGKLLNGNSRTGTLPNVPVSGRWFQSQFVQLVQNAFPAFQLDENQTGRRR